MNHPGDGALANQIMANTPATSSRILPGRMERPRAAAHGRIFWRYLSVFIALHVLALLALHPYFFSWTGVALVFLGNYVFGSLGINVGYHRLLTHQSFTCPKWLERFFVLCGVCSLQDSPGRWVAIHRMHHQHSDEQPDPHSPLVSFLWGHVGWLVVENREIATLSTFQKYAPDIFLDPFYRGLHRRHFWIVVYALHAAALLLLGYLAGWLLTGTVAGTLQFGASVLVWGVIVRTVYVWHITWAVNSAAHRWGYRNYETGEASRNNWVVALLTNGEGWHNNHHADPRCAAHGHRWWEFDLTYLSIKALSRVGLVRDVVPLRVRHQVLQMRVKTGLPEEHIAKQEAQDAPAELTRSA
jgi:stearoyl-CoA desaturase (delta-9 desaturase)